MVSKIKNFFLNQVTDKNMTNIIIYNKYIINDDNKTKNYKFIITIFT